MLVTDMFKLLLYRTHRSTDPSQDASRNKMQQVVILCIQHRLCGKKNHFPYLLISLYEDAPYIGNMHSLG